MHQPATVRYPGSVLDLRLLSSENLRPLRRAEYDRMVEMGLFQEERIELLHGLLVEMSPIGTGHCEAVRRLTELFILALHERATVSPQLAFAASDDSEPEPDLAVIARKDHSHEHPKAAYLLVEVSESSLHKDRRIKTGIYANNGVPEYWIVNLIDDVIEVRTEPQGDRYTHKG